jgi:hypothetical protein
MQKKVESPGGIYTAYGLRPDGANFEVTTPSGDFIKSFSLQTIGDPHSPEPDYSGVSYLNQTDIEAIEAILPSFPTAELRAAL